MTANTSVMGVMAYIRHIEELGVGEPRRWEVKKGMFFRAGCIGLVQVSSCPLFILLCGLDVRGAGGGGRNTSRLLEALDVAGVVW